MSDQGRLPRARTHYGWLLGLWAAGALAGTPHLVRDINTNVVPVSSFATDFTDLGTTSFFDANDGVNGSEPWTTDGTAAGTFQWGDLQQGPVGATGRQPVRAGAQTFLIESSFNTGAKVWVAGATRQSVRSVTTPELAPLVNAAPVGALGDVFLFSAFNTTTGARELWRSDGTQAGTRAIPNANGDVYSFATEPLITGSKIYFFSLTPTNVFVPWVSDGTQAGTHALGPIANMPQSHSGGPRLTRVGNFALFAFDTTDTGTELWRINLTNDAITRVADLATGTASALRQGEPLRSVNGVAIFVASEGGDDNRTTWRTDGTGAGTFEIADVEMVDNSESAYLGASDVQRLLFRVTDGVSSVATWTTDGSVANTTLLRNSELHALQRIGQRYYFTQNDFTEVWTTDGTTAGTRMLNGILTGGASMRELTGNDTVIYVRTTNLGTFSSGNIYRHVLASGATSLVTSYSFTGFGPVQSVFRFAQGRLYFDNEDAVTGRELWISDGTSAGTQLLSNLAPEQKTQDSVPGNFARFNGTLYFSADDGVHGREIWRSDGTEAGTSLFFDARPGPAGSDAAALFVAANKLFFFARDAAGDFRFWVWDGSASPPQPLAASTPLTTFGSGTCDSTGVVVNGEIFFRAFGANGTFPLLLWATDGTSAGTRIVGSIGFGTSGSCERVVVGNRLYFQGPGSGLGGLWVSDGTSVTMLADAATGPIGGMPHHLVERNSKLYFIAADATNQQRLWTTDGTLATTTKVDIFGAATPIALFGPLDNGMLAFAHEVENGGIVTHPWTTDGTTATRLSSDMSLNLFFAFVNRGKAYFTCTTGSGTGPFASGPAVTDGTPAGTRFLQDLLLQGSDAHTFMDFDGVTYFQSDIFGGQRLWRTDGTPTGTRAVADAILSQPRMAANHNLFYVAIGASSGVELFAIDNDRPVAVNDSLGSVQAGGSINANLLGNDSDADGALDTSSIVIATQPTGGTATVGANGTITYNPRANFTGADSFTYTVADDQAYASTPATVQVTVTAPPAPPPSQDGGGGGGGGGAMRAIELLTLLLMLLATLRRTRTPRAGSGRR
jgi:ELWxxDGT repeat protein